MSAPSPSARRLWNDYRARSGCPLPDGAMPAAWHFCDTKADANALVALVLRGVKRATSPSLWELEARRIPVPQVGTLNIVTDWDGLARCIIETTDVKIRPFHEVPASHAAREGEGDGSLAHWRRTHWAYYHRVLADTPYEPCRDMPVVCEHFRVVHPKPAAV